ncbi:TetR/AcrR family transcriptional regulator [Nocardiopsis potens]|uniref:TetR/AcrR family transcriptional regulator n=1 Tax=Nocardiopsis potens TaxID=1246458 RepID=UPI00034D2409|nr:TetR/AcrR family transcriptional regulator [Nocardiopsis potens]
MAESGRGRERVELIARTAVRVIAREGLRGLTHRAVDRAAGLPDGSTSYHARTRARLLEITLEHMAAEEQQALTAFFADAPPTRTEAARLLAEFVHTSVHTSAERTLARFELALEASRRPELRRIYDRAGARFRDTAEATLRGLGSPAPERHTRSLIAWCEGMVLDSVAGAGTAAPPTLDDLHTGAAELLNALLPPLPQ